MGAKQTAQSIAVWTNDSVVVLLDGIDANEHGKNLLRHACGRCMLFAKERIATRLTSRSASGKY